MRNTGATNPLDLILWPRGLIERAHGGLAAGERFALLVRHAERPPITSGMSDAEIAQLPLTKHGLRQAGSFGRQLPPTRCPIYTSPLQRTCQTTVQIAEALEAVHGQPVGWMTHHALADERGVSTIAELVERTPPGTYQICVTHDVVILACARYLAGSSYCYGDVRFLGGIYWPL